MCGEVRGSGPIIWAGCWLAHFCAQCKIDNSAAHKYNPLLPLICAFYHDDRSPSSNQQACMDFTAVPVHSFGMEAVFSAPFVRCGIADDGATASDGANDTASIRSKRSWIPPLSFSRKDTKRNVFGYAIGAQ